MVPDSCVACGSGLLENVLDLGEQSPVNSFTSSKVELKAYPLGLDACIICGHGQLMFFVDPEALFLDYFYASSTSSTLKEYSKEFAKCLAQGARKEAKVLEIASNDGVLLRELVSLGLDATGIDPAERMHHRCLAEGLKTVCDFWPSEKLEGQMFDIIVGQNVLAHTPNPHEFLLAAIEHLEEDGVAIFQTSQADMVLNGELDTIYHEHYSFFSESSARELARRSGADLLATAYTSIHGNSSVYFFGKSNEARGTALKIASSLDAKLYAKASNSIGAQLRVKRGIEDWRSFRAEANARMAAMKNLVEQARKSGLNIVSVGAAAKGITFLRAAGIEVDLLVDEAEDKIGKWVSGLDLPVKPMSAIAGIGPSFFVLSAWNFSSELSAKLSSISQKSEQGSQVVVYFPNIKTTHLAVE